MYVLFLAGLLTSAPIRPIPRPEPQPVREIYPDYSGVTNWGLLTQHGRHLNLSGHTEWSATGVIRPDGKVEFRWVHNPDGREGVSVYRTDGYRLTGRWGWADSAWVQEGEVIGIHHPDTIRDVEREP